MAGLAEILDENSRLRELNQAQASKLEEQAVRLAELEEKLGAVVRTNELLTKHFEFLDKKRELAAAERFIADRNQTTLFADSEVTVPPRDPETESADKARPDEPKDKRKTATHPRRGRRKVKDLNFPKKVVIAPVHPSTCDTCGGEHALIEPRVTHRVGWEPGRFIVVETQQEQSRCPSSTCVDSGVWTAPEPFLLPGCMVDDGLLARVIVDKWADHLPLNRQASRMKREGFDVGVNVLSGWCRNGFAQVRPLVTALRIQVAGNPLLLTDDSGFPVQDGTDGKLANGRMWVFTDQKQAFFDFSRTKEGEHPAKLLASLGFDNRRFVADGGSEYNKAEDDLVLARGGCWSHLRRYFHNAAIQHDEANVGLIAIRDLFMIERELSELAPAERLAQRGGRARAVVDGFFDWAKAMSQRVRLKSKLGGALGYAIRQESRMRLFLHFGDVPIHNNLSELLLRQPIVGRKNWLFAGSEGGAIAATGWFSLIASCMLQGIDPAMYLNDVFGRLPGHSSKWVHELTPLNWRIAVEAGDLVPMSHG